MIAPTDFAAREQAFAYVDFQLSLVTSVFMETDKRLEQEGASIRALRTLIRAISALIVVNSRETSEEKRSEWHDTLFDPAWEDCEFAIVVLQHVAQSVGSDETDECIGKAPSGKWKRISGTVLRGKVAMRKFVKQLDFAETNI